MICKNCGAQLPDDSVFCGNCGTAVEPDSQQQANFGNNYPDPTSQNQPAGFNAAQNSDYGAVSNPNMPPQSFNNGAVPGNNQNMPGQPKPPILKDKKTVIIICGVAALVLIAVIGIGVAGVLGSRPQKTIDRFMEAYLACDGEAMNKEISPTYKKAIVYSLETYDLLMDGKLKKEAGGDFDKYVEEQFTERLEDNANDFFDEFEYRLGNNYKAEYEVSEPEEASSGDLKKFNELVTRLSKKDFKMDGLMLADIEVTGKSGSKEYDNRFTLFMCKDGSKWYVIDLYEYGYTFDDFYSGLSLNDLESAFN